MVTIRPLRLPDDARAILSLDTSFETERLYVVEVTENAFRLVEVSAHYSKQYTVQLDELARLAGFYYAEVASTGNEIVGLAAAEYSEWNRRIVLHHLYVSRSHRKSGIGCALLQNVTEWARERRPEPAASGLETQNVNFAAIQFYKRAGFSLCGFDTSLLRYRQHCRSAPGGGHLSFSKTTRLSRDSTLALSNIVGYCSIILSSQVFWRPYYAGGTRTGHGTDSHLLSRCVDWLRAANHSSAA